MPRSIECDADAFAIGLEELLSDITPDVAKGISEAIPKVSRKGAKMLREEASKRWTGKTGAAYSKGFKSKTIKSGEVTTAEIGNSKFPGLVHLLEKGHATLTGRRTKAYPHVAPVFDAIEPQVMEAVGDAVDKALEG